VSELDEIRAQLQELRDLEAIRDCSLRYARGLDRHDEEMYASPYHQDAIDRHGAFLGRRDDFVPWGLSLLASEWDAHTHYITNIRVDIDGDTAHSESYVLFVQRRRDGGSHDVGGGRYIDRLERRDGEWRIAARELLIEWIGQMDRLDGFGGSDTHTPGRWDREDPSYHRPFVLPDPEGAS
jgi:hypothetical protein